MTKNNDGTNKALKSGWTTNGGEVEVNDVSVFYKRRKKEKDVII